MVHHPIESWVAQIYAAQGVPRIMVDATAKGVVLPDWVREKWEERMPVDLDPAYPIDLTFSGDGLGAFLAFQGHEQVCFFPWKSIWFVGPRGSEDGVLIPSHLPPKVLASLHGMPPPAQVPGTPEKPAESPDREATAVRKRHPFRVIKGGKS